jgi:hypothetical protein
VVITLACLLQPSSYDVAARASVVDKTKMNDIQYSSLDASFIFVKLFKLISMQLEGVGQKCLGAENASY